MRMDKSKIVCQSKNENKKKNKKMYPVCGYNMISLIINFFVIIIFIGRM